MKPAPTDLLRVLGTPELLADWSGPIEVRVHRKFPIPLPSEQAAALAHGEESWLPCIVSTRPCAGCGEDTRNCASATGRNFSLDLKRCRYRLDLRQWAVRALMCRVLPDCWKFLDGPTLTAPWESAVLLGTSALRVAAGDGPVVEVLDEWHETEDGWRRGFGLLVQDQGREGYDTLALTKGVALRDAGGTWLPIPGDMYWAAKP